MQDGIVKKKCVCVEGMYLEQSPLKPWPEGSFCPGTPSLSYKPRWNWPCGGCSWRLWALSVFPPDCTTWASGTGRGMLGEGTSPLC